MSFVDKLAEEYRFFRDALNLRAKRQEMLASNIANADTPHYKAKDLDFAAALKAATTGEGAGVPLATTDNRHLRGQTPDPAKAHAGYRSAEQGSIDGNTVNMDVERSQFADNALHYQFVVDRIREESRKILDAIQPNR